MPISRQFLNTVKRRKIPILIGAIFGFIFFWYLNGRHRGAEIPRIKLGNEPVQFTIENLSGKPFDYDLVWYLDRFGLTEDQIKLQKSIPIKSSDVTFIMYSSSNHFRESRLTLRHFRNFYNNSIIYYDLGLDEDQREELDEVCNLQVRDFDFESYPRHVRQLTTYGFKVIIAAEMLLEHPAFWMVDTSVHLDSPNCLSKVYEAVNNGTAPDFVMGQVVGKQMAYTYPEMFDYLPFPTKYHDEHQREAVVFYHRSQQSKRILKWLLLCALTEGCIAPRNSFFDWITFRASGYHRYDQSAGTILRSAFIRQNPIQFAYVHDCAKVERGMPDDEPLQNICHY